MSLDIDFIQDHSHVIGGIVTVGAGCYLIRRYMAGGWCYNKASLKGKTVLITGGNTGIGKETARDMVARGAHVVIAVRDIVRGNNAAKDIYSSTGKSVDVKQLDLASLASVKEFAEDFKRRYQRLDILINNAGVMMCPYLKSADGYELQFATNHLGHFLLTNLLLDLLKKSTPSRIVNVSSLAHKRGKINFEDLNSEKGYSPRAAYGQSKLANVLFTLELSKRLEGTGVSVYSLHPGVVETELIRHVWNRIPTLLQPVLSALSFPVFKLLMKNAVEGAQTSIYCATEPELEKMSGHYFSDCRPKEPAAQGKDKEAAKKLWEVSVTLVEKALGPVKF